MRGDFSRLRFNPRKQYTAVLEQQGRVALDADANEQCAIDAYLRTTETIDVVGQRGTPFYDAGFAISVEEDRICIGPGRFYIDGLMCENTVSLAYYLQPFLIDPRPNDVELLREVESSRGERVLWVYLEAWQRLVTALDDVCLREPALGQADTTTRLQTVWRVAAMLGKNVPNQDCCSEMDAGLSDDTLATGTMNATTGGGSDDCSCQPVPAAGYQGLENQLYRVEIHQSSAQETTFKWSRENGSVVAAITDISGETVWVDSLGPDANLGFQANQWVEITDDTYLFGQPPNQPGNLYQIASVDPIGLSMTMKTNVAPVATKCNARVRRWDQTGSSAGSAGVPFSTGTSIALENGIQVSFGSGTFNPGDYWTIPARTASGQIDWPPCGSDNAFQPPHAMLVKRAPLACIHWQDTKTSKGVVEEFVVEDCRKKFHPLTDLSPPVVPTALHVTSFNWRNDDITTFDLLIENGLSITFDQAPTGPVNGANWIITLEPVAEVQGDYTNEEFADVSALTDVDDAAAPPRVSIIPRSIAIVDSDVQTYAGTTTLSWQFSVAMNETVLEDFNRLLSIGASIGQFGRARVKLVGRTIFSGAGPNQLFLDGQTFGMAAVRADGTTPRIDLQLPSGNGVKASDFEGWFYVAPILEIVSVAIDYPQVTASYDNGQILLSADGKRVSPRATVTVNYPAVANTEISLTNPPPSSASTAVARIPSSAMLGIGETTVSFAIAIQRAVFEGQTVTFDIIASLSPVIESSTQTATFAVEFMRPGQK